MGAFFGSILTYPLKKVREEENELKIIEDPPRCNDFLTFREDCKATPFATLPFASFITEDLGNIFRILE